MRRLEIPAGIVAIEPRASERIEALLAVAERRQDEELERATTAALRQVPFFFRPVIRRVLGL